MKPLPESPPGQPWLRVDESGTRTWWSFRPASGPPREVLVETKFFLAYLCPRGLVVYVHKDLLDE